MFRLSVCEGTVLRSLSFLERVRAIARAGFGVDLWGWEENAIDAIAGDPDIEICAMPGWVGGSMVHPDGIEAYLAGVKENLAVAERFGCRNLSITTGALDAQGQMAHAVAAHPAAVWISAYKCLSQVAELAEKHGVVYSLEQLNTKVDHAGYPLPRTEDVVRLIEQVGSQRIRLLCDIYHIQVEEGNVVQSIRDYRGYIGYVHVADVPGRHEPGTGEINYRQIAAVLREVGYDGVIGMEAFPEAGDFEAMERFRALFS